VMVWQAEVYKHDEQIYWFPVFNCEMWTIYESIPVLLSNDKFTLPQS
jgi:hypothetical protein